MDKQTRTFEGQYFRLDYRHSVKINQLKLLLIQCNIDGTELTPSPLAISIFGITNTEYNAAGDKLTIETTNTIYEFKAGHLFDFDGLPLDSSTVFYDIEDVL